MQDIMRGKAWVFGDDIPNDGGLMDLRFFREQVFDPAVLAEHTLEKFNPDFAKQARPGDLVVAGRLFAQGNPHVQGWLGLKALGVGVVTESMLRQALRTAGYIGVPFLSRCPGVTGMARTGDELEVNFVTGEIRNHTTGAVLRGDPLPAPLLEMIRAGGGLGYLQRLVAVGELR